MVGNRKYRVSLVWDLMTLKNTYFALSRPFSTHTAGFGEFPTQGNTFPDEEISETFLEIGL